MSRLLNKSTIKSKRFNFIIISLGKNCQSYLKLSQFIYYPIIRFIAHWYVWHLWLLLWKLHAWIKRKTATKFLRTNAQNCEKNKIKYIDLIWNSIESMNQHTDTYSSATAVLWMRKKKTAKLFSRHAVSRFI